MQIDHLEAILGDVVITVYEGEYDEENGEYSGPGIARLDNENVYEGDFAKGLFHGHGKFTWANGMSYEGDFKRNKITGQGTYNYLDGSTYVGSVFDGKRHGQGKLTTSAGQIYEGDWKMGKRHGNGKMIYNEEGNYAYSGEWNENLRHGYGTMKYPSGNTFEGEWRDDKKNGYGIMIWRDLDEVYTGEWMDDKPHGLGEHIWGDSSAKTIKKQNCNIYRGMYEEGRRYGFGTFFYMNGSQYSGQWRDDVKEGPGIFIHPDGRIVAGNYENNRLISSIDEDFQQLRVTEDINPQYHLNLFITYFQSYPALEINPFLSLKDRDINQKKLINDIERLLLKYNSYIKVIYRHYNEIANRQRIREIPYLPNLDLIFHNETEQTSLVSMEIQQRYYKFLKSTINARTINKRFYCLNLEHMIRFLREIGFINYYYNSDDVIQCYQQMKDDQLTTSMKQYGELLQSLVKKEQERRGLNQSSDRSPSPSEANLNDPPELQRSSSRDSNDMDQKSVVSSLLQEADLHIGRLLDDYQDVYAFDSSFYQQVHQPLLEHEFIELFVRVIGERQLRLPEYPLNLYHATEKVLAKEVLPFSSNPDLRRLQFYSLFYDNGVQDLLRGRPNRNQSDETEDSQLLPPYQKIENIWKLFPKISSYQQSITLIPTGGIVILNEFIQYFLKTGKEKKYVKDSLTESEFFHILYGVTEESIGDTSWKDRRIHFEDFLEYLCRVVVSDYWIFVNNPFHEDVSNTIEGSDEMKETNNTNKEDDEFNVIASAGNTLNQRSKGSLSRPDSPSHEENLLQSRLTEWLHSL